MAAPISVDSARLRHLPIRDVIPYREISVTKNYHWVSSVLNRDTKQFGKKHLCDGDNDTCWNSDQGSPQWIIVEFENRVAIEGLHIQFQGGFAGRDCWIEGCVDKESEFNKLQEFYPKDVNSLQTFQFTSEDAVSSVKIVFNNSTDFFGRITIYKLDLLGKES